MSPGNRVSEDKNTTSLLDCQTVISFHEQAESYIFNQSFYVIFLKLKSFEKSVQTYPPVRLFISKLSDLMCPINMSLLSVPNFWEYVCWCACVCIWLTIIRYKQG